MTEHLLKAVLSSGTSTLGSFVRVWLLLTGTLSATAGAVVIGSDTHSAGAALYGALVGIVALGPVVAMPAAVAVAIAFVALKW